MKTKYYYAFVDKDEFKQILDETMDLSTLTYFNGKMTLNGKAVDITDNIVRDTYDKSKSIIVRFVWKQKTAYVYPAKIKDGALCTWEMPVDAELVPTSYHLCDVKLQTKNQWLGISKTTEENKDAQRGIVYTEAYDDNLESIRNTLSDEVKQLN